MAGLRRWWSRKYNLPPNHELFQRQSVEVLNQEMIEDLMLQAEDVRQELEELDDRPTPKSRRDLLLDQLNRINKALGEEEAIQSDPLWDYWEACLARGEEPDLDMTMEDLDRVQRGEVGSTLG